MNIRFFFYVGLDLKKMNNIDFQPEKKFKKLLEINKRIQMEIEQLTSATSNDDVVKMKSSEFKRFLKELSSFKSECETFVKQFTEQTSELGEKCKLIEQYSLELEAYKSEAERHRNNVESLNQEHSKELYRLKKTNEREIKRLFTALEFQLNEVNDWKIRTIQIETRNESLTEELNYHKEMSKKFKQENEYLLSQIDILTKRKTFANAIVLPPPFPLISPIVSAPDINQNLYYFKNSSMYDTQAFAEQEKKFQAKKDVKDEHKLQTGDLSSKKNASVNVEISATKRKNDNVNQLESNPNKKSS